MKLTYIKLYMLAFVSAMLTMMYEVFLTTDKLGMPVIILIIMITLTAVIEHEAGKQYIREGRV